MRDKLKTLVLAMLPLALGVSACRSADSIDRHHMNTYVLDYETPLDRALQSQLVAIDSSIRAELGMTGEDAAAGVLDLRSQRLAMIHPDRIEYAASVPKIGILLAYFHLHPEAAVSLDAETRHDLELMARASSNEKASRFSREMGLLQIQSVLDAYGFYDQSHGGGIWVGKHYGPNSERIGDPVADHSHAATIRQLLRFYLLLEQERLVSRDASRTMRSIFASPAIPHDEIKFVKALQGRDVEIIRKWGSWQDWLHDTAVVRGDDRHYIIAGLTHHPRGDEYLERLAVAVDDLLRRD